MRPALPTSSTQSPVLCPTTPAVLRVGDRVNFAASILVFAGLMALAAQVRIPVPGTTVPMTLQSFAVLMAGFTLGPVAAVSAMLLYLICGVAGLPVFAPQSLGLAGDSGGYIVGFVLAAFLISLLRGPRNASAIRLVFAGLTGLTSLFACGLAWRYVFAMMFGLDAGYAVSSGLFPFLPKAIVELLLAVAIVRVLPGPAGALGHQDQ